MISASSPQLLSLIRSLVGEQIKEWIETVHHGNLERYSLVIQEQKESIGMIQNLASYVEKIDLKLHGQQQILDNILKKQNFQQNDLMQFQEEQREWVQWKTELCEQVRAIKQSQQEQAQEKDAIEQERRLAMQTQQQPESGGGSSGGTETTAEGVRALPDMREMLTEQEQKVAQLEHSLQELIRGREAATEATTASIERALSMAVITTSEAAMKATKAAEVAQSSAALAEKAAKEAEIALISAKASATEAAAAAVRVEASSTAALFSSAAAPPASEAVSASAPSAPAASAHQSFEVEMFQRRVDLDLTVLQKEKSLLEREVNLLREELQHLRLQVQVLVHQQSQSPTPSHRQPREEMLLTTPHHSYDEGAPSFSPQSQEPRQERVLSPRTPYPHTGGRDKGATHRPYPPAYPQDNHSTLSVDVNTSGGGAPPSDLTHMSTLRSSQYVLHEDPKEGDQAEEEDHDRRPHAHFDLQAPDIEVPTPLSDDDQPRGTGSIRHQRSKILTRQLTLSDELVTLLAIIADKEKDVKVASERKLLIKNHIKGKLTDFQEKFGRSPTLEEKEAMAELYLQHQEVSLILSFSLLTDLFLAQASLLKEEAEQSLQDAKELLEEKRFELEDLSFGRETEVESRRG
jgi:hypothetical protein